MSLRLSPACKELQNFNRQKGERILGLTSQRNINLLKYFYVQHTELMNPFSMIHFLVLSHNMEQAIGFSAFQAQRERSKATGVCEVQNRWQMLLNGPQGTLHFQELFLFLLKKQRVNILAIVHSTIFVTITFAIVVQRQAMLLTCVRSHGWEEYIKLKLS